MDVVAAAGVCPPLGGLRARDTLPWGCAGGSLLDRYEERVAKAEEFKESGNELYQKGRILEAVHEWERCISAWRFLTTSQADWKKKGIDDKFTTAHDGRKGLEGERLEQVNGATSRPAPRRRPPASHRGPAQAS